MNPETHTALLETIERWKKNREADKWENVDFDHKPDDLCCLFRIRTSAGRLDGWTAGRLDCTGCPVQERTRHPACRESPETEAIKVYSAWKIASKYGEEAQLLALWQKAAQRMVDFLESLLPEAQP